MTVRVLQEPRVGHPGILGTRTCRNTDTEGQSKDMSG